MDYYYVVLLVIGLILLMQLKFAIVKDRFALTILSLVLMVYFLYGGFLLINTSDVSIYYHINPIYILPTLLHVLLCVVVINLGYFSRIISVKIINHDASNFYLLKKWQNDSCQHYFDIKYCTFASIIGIIFTIIYIYLRGGILLEWSRQGESFSGAGIVSSLTNMTLIYPIFSYYYNDSREDSLSTILIIIYIIYALLSGRTTQHILNFAPFAVIWLTRNRLTYRRIIVLFLLGIIMLTVSRFSREIGSTIISASGTATIAYVNFVSGESRLSPLQSFGEIIAFSKTMEVIDKTEFEMGQSYLVPFLGTIPGYFYENKNNFIAEHRADAFLPAYYGFEGHLWPTGFYGEAYMNFGLIGLIAVSFMFGWLIRYAEFMIASNKMFYGIPYWFVGCLVASSLVIWVRMDFNAMYNVLLQIILLIIMRFFIRTRTYKALS